MTENQEAGARLKRRALATLAELEALGVSFRIAPPPNDRRIVKPNPLARLKMRWHELFQTTRG